MLEQDYYHRLKVNFNRIKNIAYLQRTDCSKYAIVRSKLDALQI